MIWLWIKKSFFDGWDSLISLVVWNIGYLVVIGGFYGVLVLLQYSSLGALLLFCIVLFAHVLYISAASVAAKEIADYRIYSLKDVLRKLKSLVPHVGLLYLVIVVQSLMLFVMFFYLSYQAIGPTLIAVVFGWMLVGVHLALPYYMALAVRMSQDKPLKSLKKAFILVVDNLGFSLFLALYQLVSLALTVVTATIVPGVFGLQLMRQTAVRLLLLKYDYLEEHPQTKRSEIPWEEVLFEEKERIGRRSFKSLLFPWKD
ncbi:MAG: hypothetical protein ACOXZ4_05190 [Sphaerochaetaceae bacterium]|jgi:hypothetical protein